MNEYTARTRPLHTNTLAPPRLAKHSDATSTSSKSHEFVTFVKSLIALGALGALGSGQVLFLRRNRVRDAVKLL